jgi:type I restriction enzyme M protein
MPTLSETDTVIKRILPYLRRRGYDIETDLDFETPLQQTDRYAKGYADILIKCGKARPQFLIEAKRDSRKLAAKDATQAIQYGVALKVPFVVVTNGREIQCLNTKTKQAIRWGGRLVEKIPTKAQLPQVLSTLKSNPSAQDIDCVDDPASPFRPGLPKKQLNALFKRCHNTIRRIEKDEENAFADFSKFLFLKLLEEKADLGDFTLPYTYSFAELASRPPGVADQIKTAIDGMIATIRALPYGEVLDDAVRLKAPKTYLYIVRELASVYFGDTNLDSKGAAFEYFVRATLKGKKLGQYFTPRELIEVMVHLVGREKVVNALASGTPPKVLDPACGTGGFLVYLMNLCTRILEERVAANKILATTKTQLIKKLREQTFYGSDANPGVACAAKMNMIVAGDGHTNILPGDSLTLTAKNWDVANPDCDLILTNPPFGTSENESLTQKDKDAYPCSTGKGQLLFLQKMALCTRPDGEICTVIDEGVLNIDTAAAIRKWLLRQCKIIAVVRLPEETFQPNKINVRSSVLYLRKRENPDEDLEEKYNITFCDLQSLGYHGSGDPIRGFDQQRFLNEVSEEILNQENGSPRSGYNWRAFDISIQDIAADQTFRLDLKYWDPETRAEIAMIAAKGAQTIEALSTEQPKRGKSPNAELYVDEADGYAVVVKAGSSISKFGELVLDDSDYIEKQLYEEMAPKAGLKKGDVLLASTGEGTLGKACVFDSDKPAIADGHVTIVRVGKAKVDPTFLADYLRAGVGAAQVRRLHTGSTGLIELTPEQVKTIAVDTLQDDLAAQNSASAALRAAENEARGRLKSAGEALAIAQSAFRNAQAPNPKLEVQQQANAQ